MARRLELGADAFTIRWSGLDALLVTRTELSVPYSSIRLVTVALDSLPGAFAFRLGVSTAPFGGSRRGRFRVHGAWWLLDLHDPVRAVVLDVDDGPYERVAIEPESDPHELADALRTRSRRP